MFSLIAPFALVGLSLLVIPVLLHLFKPRKVRVVPFSSLRWLRDTQIRISRRIKWHQIALFLLRAALIALLVLALARPVFSWRRAGAKAERFIILDLSRSMNYQPVARDRPIDFGRELAERLLLKGLAGDRSTLLLTGSSPNSAGPLTADPGIYLAQLRSLRAGLEDGEVSAPLKLVPPLLLPKRANAALELFFITDNYAHSWSPSDITTFLKEVAAPVNNAQGVVKVQVIDVGPAQPQNAWIAGAQLIESRPSAAPSIKVAVSAVGDQAQTRIVRLSGMSALPEYSKEVALDAGQIVSVEFALPPRLDLAGKIARINLEPPDALPSDDTYWLNLDARGGLRILVIEPEATQIEELQPGFHLRTALAALSSADQGRLEVIRRSDLSLKKEDIAEADVVILADVPALVEGLLTALLERVESGAGLAVFLGPLIDREFYNTKLHNPLHPSRSLLPLEIGDGLGQSPGADELAVVTDAQWNHPLLFQLFDPTLGDLNQTTFKHYYALKVPSGREDIQVIASINSSAPAIVESVCGAGKVLVFNTTANDLWSDLARRKSYVPLIDRTLAHLAGGLRLGTFKVGETVVRALPHADPQAAVVVITPSGRKIIPAWRTIAGRVVMQLDAAPEAGVYRVEYQMVSGSRESFLFIVSVAPQDSSLLKVNESVLRKWWESAEFEMVAPSSAVRHIPVAADRMELDPFLMTAAFLVLLGEMLLVHQCCPKAHPKVVSDSLVSRHGFFGSGQ